MPNLSVIIVTKNEAHNIIDCLKSVDFADEIIVFDSGSKDGTPALCRSKGAKVTITPDWPGDGPQKNRALKKAQGKWVLSLDADERLSPELAKAIQALSEKTPYAAYALAYRSTYCGKTIKFGDWRNESHVRLFQRDKGTFSEDTVHCHLRINGKIGKLKAPLIHHPFPYLETVLNKMNQYSTQGAQISFKQGKKASLWTALSHGFWAFFRGYILKSGWLDGKAGFLLAVSNGQGTYYRYLKLMYLCQNPS